MTTNVLFVCLGNICRSPLAENLLRRHVQQAGAADLFEIDSAGTAAYHVGEAPDARMMATAQRRGLNMTGRARQFRRSDFDQFDLIVAMDEQNRADILRLAQSDAEREKVRMLREFDSEAGYDLEVPDPYYGGPDGFDEVYQMVDRCTERLLQELTDRAK